MKTIPALVLALSLMCCGEAPDPGPDAATECQMLCSVVDDDPLTLPSNRCEAGDYDLCVEECENRSPAGNWCPAP